MANCIPPWQPQFACKIERSNSRAEFCRIADPKKYPGKKEAYYTYAEGTSVAELYFQTNSTWFSTKDTEVEHPTDLTSSIGYGRGSYVYAFVVTEATGRSDFVRRAEIRVYDSIDAFSNQTKDNEIVRLKCDAQSIVADLPSIRP